MNLFGLFGKGTAAQPEVKQAGFHRGRSRQDYVTPADFRAAIVRRFGQPVLDLAGTLENKFGNLVLTPDLDSLDDGQNWGELASGGICWLNPPFSKIGPWVEKCAKQSINRRCQILLLVPASIGSDWFVEHVWPHANVWALNGRLTFVGQEQGYPKDCMLAIYGAETAGIFKVWNWKKDVLT